MKKHWIEYHPSWKRSPMSFWVHIPTKDELWFEATEFDPPVPKPVAGKGFPYYFVENNGFTFEFASLAELRVLIETFSKPLLPSNLLLSVKRGANYGPNNHWLNRLPKDVTSWRYRRRALPYLKMSLRHFESQS